MERRTVTDLADSILAAYHAADLTKIELPEAAEPLGWPRVIFSRSFTMNDRRRIEKTLEKSESDAMLRVVVSHARDAEGKRLFGDEDLPKVGATPAWLISHIAQHLLSSMPTFEDEAGK